MSERPKERVGHGEWKPASSLKVTKCLECPPTDISTGFSPTDSALCQLWRSSMDIQRVLRLLPFLCHHKSDIFLNECWMKQKIALSACKLVIVNGFEWSWLQLKFTHRETMPLLSQFRTRALLVPETAGSNVHGHIVHKCLLTIIAELWWQTLSYLRIERKNSLNMFGVGVPIDVIQLTWKSGKTKKSLHITML